MASESIASEVLPFRIMSVFKGEDFLGSENPPCSVTND